MKKIILLVFAIAFCQLSNVNCQNKTGNWCGFDEKLKEQLKDNPALQQQFEQWRENVRTVVQQMEMEKSASGTVQIIPVVVHVIHDNGIGNITEAQVKDGIRVLNEDFIRMNADTVGTRAIFKPHAGSADFEFRLAQIDPNGNPTNGIVRINSQLTWDADDNTKTLSYWNSSKYFNIWLVNTISGSTQTSTILGYAQFPGWGAWNTYGVIMLHTQFGRFGTSASEGRTTTHEVGHCLNLFHTFEGGCGGSNCNTNGDDVCDTPPTANSTQGCSLTQNLCSNDVGGQSPYTTNVEDQIENYMSYDDCQNMFSNIQISRMKAAITAHTQLQNLVSATNLTATGVDVLSAADFYSSSSIVCLNQTVKFTDASIYGQNAWAWNFSGGNPATSFAQNPEVTYSTPGLYDVSLAVTDGNTTQNKTASNYILVVSPDSNYLPFSESFENINLPNYRWYAANLDNDGNTFEKINGTGFSGNSCIKLDNSGNTSGNRDELIVGSFDFTGMVSVSVKFKTAYAQKDTSTKDKLVMYVSSNCGASWAPRYTKTGTTLASAPNQTSAFTPADTSQWKSHTATLTSSMFVNNVLIKFVFESDEGNNFYIDDINITGTYSAIPVLISPANNSVGLSDSLIVDWHSVGGVDMYQHQLDTSPNFNSPLIDLGQHNYISIYPYNDDTKHDYIDLLHGQKYYWRARTITGMDTSAWSSAWNFTVSTTGVGIETPISNPETQLSIYPNPNGGKFFVSGFSFPASGSITIYNILGEVVCHLPVTSNQQLSTNLPKGIYFLQLTSAESSVVKKFVVE